MARVTYFYREMSEYIQIDLDLLRERHDLTVIECRSRWPRPLRLLQLVRSSDVVMSWFASWHSLFPALACRLCGTPMVLTVGGYDTATGAGSGYGAARGWLKRLVTRVTMRLATRLIVISEFSRRETLACGADPAKLVTGPLGLDPARYPDPRVAREELAVTVGGVNTSNLTRKGLEAFVQAAALLPDTRFVVIGAWTDGAVERLRKFSTPNVEFTGRVSHEEKVAWLWRARVVVQASRHEAFGLSLAEGMLCGAVPVVTDAGALPEVVGDTGVVIASPDPAEIAEGIRRARVLGDGGGRRARARVQTNFTIEQRRVLLREVVEALSRGARVQHAATRARDLYLGLLTSVEGAGGTLVMALALLRAAISRARLGRGALHVRRPVVIARDGIRWCVPAWDNSFAAAAPGEASSPVVPELLRLLEKRPQRVCLDIGANLGFVCMTLARDFPERLVIAVEPIPWLAAALRRTATLNRFAGVTVVDRAVAAVPALDLAVPRLAGVWFTTLSSSECASRGAMELPREDVSVRGIGLDALLDELGVAPDEVACVKIDIEGAEARALATGPRLLAARPPIVFEALTSGHRAEVERLLREHGYGSFRSIDDTNVMAAA